MFVIVFPNRYIFANHRIIQIYDAERSILHKMLGYYFMESNLFRTFAVSKTYNRNKHRK